VTWGDCAFEQKQITVREDPETGLKNRPPGEIRIVPMIPEMCRLLEQMKSKRPREGSAKFVMRVHECQKAMDRAAKRVGMARVTHHDLKHLFASQIKWPLADTF